MQYENMKKGIFRERLNRFVAVIEVDGRQEKCHVKNTGRCRELLLPGAEVLIQCSTNPNRTTAYDLIQVKKGNRLVNIDSQAPNKAVHEMLQEGRLFDRIVHIKPESTFLHSRFDFYVEAAGRKIFMEVKGVTLEERGVAYFPDAPTERGIKHLNELQLCIAEGYEAFVIFVIQMKGVHRFEPNRRTHPAFADALIAAKNAGVQVLAFDCRVTEGKMRIDMPVPVVLE